MYSHDVLLCIILQVKQEMHALIIAPSAKKVEQHLLNFSWPSVIKIQEGCISKPRLDTAVALY